MRIDALPERLVILGGGYIAAEFAHVFSALRQRGRSWSGAATVLRQARTTTCPTRSPRWPRAWDVRLGAEPVDAVPAATAARSALDLGRRRRRRARRPAAGRHRARSPTATGSTSGRRGRGCTGRPGRRRRATSAPRPTASSRSATSARIPAQARRQPRGAGGRAQPAAPGRRRSTTDHRFVPSAVFTEPQIASVGLTEQEAARAGASLRRSTSQDYGDIAVRLGDGGHHRVLQGDRRPATPAGCSARTSWASRPRR